MKSGYPGIEQRIIICDICGFKLRLKDVVRVQDRYNPQNQMIVCHKDLDKLNPQFIPFKLPREVLLSDPIMVRPESEHLNYVPMPLSDRLPGAPRFITITLDPLENLLYLTWQGPIDPGSSPVLGYIVKRADPMYAVLHIIEQNTDNPAAYFLDPTADPEGTYNYQIAAISTIGVGAYSDMAYWPYEGAVDPNIDYLITSDTEETITTGAGEAIIL